MWRCFVGFVVADILKGHSVYTIRVKHSKNGGAKFLKSCVFKDVPFFEKLGTTQSTTRRDTTE
jgi:hypothetical protein